MSDARGPEAEQFRTWLHSEDVRSAVARVRADRSIGALGALARITATLPLAEIEQFSVRQMLVDLAAEYGLDRSQSEEVVDLHLTFRSTIAQERTEGEGPRTRRPRRRDRRRTSVAVAVAVIAVGAVATVVVPRLGPDRRLADPATVALPPPTEASGAVAFLRGGGAPFVALVDLTDDLAAGRETAAGCSDLATSRLPTVGDPPMLLAMAAQIPDPVTSELAVEHFSVLVVSLQSCGQDRPVDEERLRFTRTLLLRRFVEIGLR